MTEASNKGEGSVGKKKTSPPLSQQHDLVVVSSILS